MKDLIKFLDISNNKNRDKWLQNSFNIFECFESDIHVRFLHSNGLKTKDGVSIETQDDGSYMENHDMVSDGDVTVTLEVLRAFKKCPTKNINEVTKSVTEKMISNVDHLTVLYDDKTLNDLKWFLGHIQV